jgi:hypothetical protein
MLKRLNPEIVLGALLASVFWAGVLGWQAAYAPTEKEKQECNEAAKKATHKAEECKTLWERTTTDPVAMFTFVLAVSTIGLWVATGGLYFAGKQAIKETRRIGEAQVRAYVSIKSVTVTFWSLLEHPIVKFSAFNTGQSPAKNFLWNITIQYAAGTHRHTLSFNDKWQSRSEIDIPATSDAPSQAAAIPNMPLDSFRGIIDKGLIPVIRVKIDFRYTDVFDQDRFGESYFHGLATDLPTAVFAKENEIHLTPTGKIADWDV